MHLKTKKRVNKLAVILFLFASASCSKKMLPQGGEKIMMQDSVHEHTTVIYKDTSIFIPGQSITVVDSIPCPEAILHTVKKDGRLTAKINISNGKIEVNCNQDSLLKVISFLESKVTTLQKIHTTETTKGVPVEVTRYRVPKWVWWLMGANVLYITWYFRKGIFSIIQSVIKF